MILPLQKFSLLLENMAASVQGRAVQLIDLSVGSVLRALLEASAAIALWLQWLILQVLAMTRAATSTGADLDSWMADFSLVRLPGTSSSGQVTFARYTPGMAATIPVGTQVMSNDGLQAFVVVQDPSNPAWNGVAGYAIAPTIVSVTVPAQASVAGASGNVQAGAISLITRAIPGIDSAINPAAFSEGVDAENDIAFRQRFPLYINSRSKATIGAIDYAVASVQQGLRYTVLENVTTAGVPAAGNFWVVVDDGSGAPPSSLLTGASFAVDLVRPIGSTYSVTGPGVLAVTIALAIVTSNSATKTTVAANIQQAIANWIQKLPIAGTLAISKLEALAHDTDTTVISVVEASINGAMSDVTASASQVLISTSIVVT